MANGNLIIGLVCEGKRDQMALEAIFDYLNGVRVNGRRLVSHRLQPAYKDATRGPMERGGEDKVRKWCQTKQKDRSRKIFRPAFVDPNSPPCDYVVILHDADQLGGMNAHAPAIPLPVAPCSATDRGKYVLKVLKKWLWPSSAIDPDADRYLLHVAVQALETWYIAAGDAAIPMPEDVDPVPHMIRLWPSMEDPNKPGKLKKINIDGDYTNFNQLMIRNYEQVKNACPYFCNLITDLEAIT